MKTTLIFRLFLLIVSLFTVLLHTALGLPEGAVARLGTDRIFGYDITYSPDGKLLAVARSNGIQLYNAQSGEELNLITGHTRAIYSVSFSPDGQTIASASLDDTVRLWDVQTGNEKQTLTRHTDGHAHEVRSVSFSPDGQTIASASDDRTIRLWNVQTGTLKRRFTGHTDDVLSVVFSPDGQTITSASGNIDETVRLWDVQTGNEKRRFTGHVGNVNSVVFSPDGQAIASGGDDGIVRLWDVQTGTLKQTLGTTRSVRSVVFSPDGQTLASVSLSNSTVRLWDRLWSAETPVEKKKLTAVEHSGHTSSVNSVSFSPDGQTLASASTDTTIRLWDVQTGTEKKTLTGHESKVYSVSFSPDGQTIASASADTTIRLWDVQTGTLKQRLAGDRHGGVFSVSFSPDGQTLASGEWGDTTVRLWDVQTGLEKQRLAGHGFEVFSAVFSPDGQTLASASRDKTIRLWDVQTGTEKHTLIGHTWWVYSVVFSPDGQTLASASGDKTIRLWDVQTGTEKHTLIGHKDPVLSVSFSPDGQTLASASGWQEGLWSSADDTVRLWDVQTGTEKHTLIGHKDPVLSVSFSPDGQTIASGSEDRTVLLWRVTPTEPTEASTTAATLSISPPSVVSPAIGEQLELSLNITGGEAVAGYQATVQFDTTALRYASGANGDYLPAGAFFVEPKVEGNLVKLNAASLAGESNGDGTLATLTFEVISVKASTLTLSDVLLTNSDGEAFLPTVENAEITESTQLKGDVNADGIVNIQDLVLVAGQLGQTGTNSADINGDGQVNIQDLVLVAGALGTTAAAPSLYPQALEMLTATDIKQWLSEVEQLELTDTTSQRGILFLQQLLIALTPKETALLANYPNPFNPETWIPYHLAKDADVTLHIYAVNGTLVRTLTLGHQPAGMYQSRSRAAYWDGKNEFGESVASGLYFYTLSTESTRDSVTAGDFTATRKMLIRK